MVFNDRYKFYFENKGICPLCESLLIPHVGCICVDCALCIDDVINYGRYHRSTLRNYFWYLFAHKLSKSKLKNKRFGKLDKSGKKFYSENNNERIQEQFLEV
jgi:hypothetical protein